MRDFEFKKMRCGRDNGDTRLWHEAHGTTESILEMEFDISGGVEDGVDFTDLTSFHSTKKEEDCAEEEARQPGKDQSGAKDRRISAGTVQRQIIDVTRAHAEAGAFISEGAEDRQVLQVRSLTAWTFLLCCRGMFLLSKIARG